MAEKIMGKRLRRCAILFVAAGVGLAAQAGAQTWNQPAGGNWNSDANWDAAPFPNAPGAVANLNNDVTGSATVNLNQDITVGTLNLGDVNGSHSFHIGSGGDGTNRLIFEAATPGAGTTLNISPAAFPNNFTFNTISANVRVGGTGSLTVNLTGTAANTQPLAFSGEIDVNGNTLIFAGAGTGGVVLNNSARFVGTGTIVKNGVNTLSVNSSVSTFTGTMYVNNGTLTVADAAALTTPTNLVINGYATNSAFVGGTVRIGSSNPISTVPGNRIPSTLITFNGGYLNDSGQALKDGAAGAVVSSSTAAMHFNSGYSTLDVMTGNGSAGTTLDVGTITRNPGATLNFRHAANAKLVAGNAASLLVGGGGEAGTPTISIIPWMATNSNVFAHGNQFVTWDGTRFRQLTSSEMADSITAGATANVTVFNVNSIPSDVTVNALQITNFGQSNMGAGRTITITSGALILQNGGSVIGAPGGAQAGTISFGSAEGIVWSVGNNSNGIGAVITGTGGLTKAGTGTLTLTGNNTYSGTTHVAGGTLRVGDGTFASDLGTGDVKVAAGAVLQISSANAIDDNASLTLDMHGIYNGKVVLDTGITEQVGALYFGGVLQAAGTYGSSSSAATFQFDEYFSGNGILSVVPVPEPSFAGAIVAGAALLLRRRKH